MLSKKSILCALVASCFLSFLEGNLYNRYDQRLENAVNFINRVQQPDSCKGLEYGVIGIGINGGFAAQFQYAAKEWMHFFASYNFSIPVLIQGRLIGYSDNSVCDYAKHEWTCYFKPMSECEAELLKTGRRVPDNKPRRYSPIPDEFQKYGSAFWWGAVQYKMFQLQPAVVEHIHAQAQLMNHDNGFPFGLPLAGLHVRHGDKRIDGFKEHSMEEELNILRNSPDCSVINAVGDCFSLLNTSAHGSLITLHRLTKKHGIVLDKLMIDQFNRTAVDHNSGIALDPHSLYPIALHAVHNLHHHNHIQSPTSHDTSHNDSLRSHNQLSSSSLEESKDFVIPVQLFVASDDVNVLISAARQGHLTAPIGVSQETTTAHDGMLKTLLTHPELAHRATMEIISDIYFLSQCNTLIGISASQVFRMAVAMSNVTGTLHFAAALDGDQINRVKQLSVKYDVPFPEQFYLM